METRKEEKDATIDYRTRGRRRLKREGRWRQLQEGRKMET
jgi:hypothetical protein